MLRPPDYDEQQASVATLLRSFRDEKVLAEDTTPEKLVYLLDHAYTPAELGFAALKGADAAVAGVLTAAARQADFDLYLALLTIEESGAAEYSGDYGRYRRWNNDEEDAFEAGEVFDHTITLSDWRRPDGETPALGNLPADEEEISPPDACEGLEPDEEHFREATGNEGASFERTYRRAALVLWPSERFFAVLSEAGLPATLPYLQDLTQRWADSPPDNQASLWRQAHDLASHMIARWPKQVWHYRKREDPSEVGQMLALLNQLDDADTIERLLADVVAAGCHAKSDNEIIIDALDHLPPSRRGKLIERVIAGTGAEALDACADLLARAAAAWQDGQVKLEGAATRLLKALPGDPARAAPRPAWQSGPEVNAGIVVDLLTGLSAIDERLTEQATGYVLAWPKTYGLDAVLVPAARRLLSPGAETPPALEPLRTACLAHLRTRIAEPLAPPADWRRDSALPCRCPLCTDLARFLSDSERKTWTLKAAEPNRSHVEQTIKQARCDVDTTTDRRGRPYSLICTKNQASYERRAKQRAQDLKDVARLAG